MTYLLALDQGTSSSRSIVFDPNGTSWPWRSRSCRKSTPQPGWVEHDRAGDLAHCSWSTAREVLSTAGITAAQLRAVGITNQRETTLIWNRRTGQPDSPRHRLAGSPRRAHLRRTSSERPRADSIQR
jgi:glycerol kinase